MIRSPPNNLKQKRDSKKYKISRIPKSEYKEAQERWETEDIQKEMNEAKPVDLDSIPLIYGDAKQEPNMEDEHNKLSFEPGQLGGKRKRKHKRKTRRNKSRHKRYRSNRKKHSNRKSRSNKTRISKKQNKRHTSKGKK